MKHFFLFLFLFPLSHFLSAQIQWDINFAFDQASLSKKEEQQLDSLIQAHPHIEGIKLTGHTDERGNVDYNMELSRKRMESVRVFLNQLGIADTLIEAAYFGESMPRASNADESGRQKNRRVEILISLKEVEEMLEAEPINSPDPILITKAEVIQIPQGDTLLEVEGAQVVMSKKDFQKYKECLEINFIVDGREALENEMSTMSSTGTPLISCGMMEIKLNGACAGGCFEPALKIRLPYPKGDCPRCEQGNFYNFLANGSWRLNPNKEVEIVSIEGEKFYELRLSCPMKVNCDCEDEIGEGGRDRIVFKWPRKYRMQRINVLYNSPTGNYPFSRWKKRKARGAIPCKLTEAEGFVYFHFKDKYGNLIEGEKISLNDFKHSFRKVCKDKKEKGGFLFFKRYKYKFYKRYKITKKQLKAQLNAKN